jgi:hypothetical protein
MIVGVALRLVPLEKSSPQRAAHLSQAESMLKFSVPAFQSAAAAPRRRIVQHVSNEYVARVLFW